MAKEILELIKLQIPAGGANPAPPVGPALGQRGLNIGDFVKQFNDRTKNLEKGVPIPVLITSYKDKKFTFVTKLPPVSHYLRKAARIDKGSTTPGRELVGKITNIQIEFHEWFPSYEESHLLRKDIHTRLSVTHKLSYCYPFYWERQYCVSLYYVSDYFKRA